MHNERQTLAAAPTTHSKIITTRVFSFPAVHSSPCSSHRWSFSSVKDLAQGLGEVGPQLVSHAPLEERGTPRGVLKDWPLFTLHRPQHLRVTGHNAFPSGAVLSALWQRGRTPASCIQPELRATAEGLRTSVMLQHKTPLWASAPPRKFNFGLWSALIMWIGLFNWAGNRREEGCTTYCTPGELRAQL